MSVLVKYRRYMNQDDIPIGLPIHSLAKYRIYHTRKHRIRKQEHIDLPLYCWQYDRTLACRKPLDSAEYIFLVKGHAVLPTLM